MLVMRREVGGNSLEMEPAAWKRGRGFAAFSCGKDKEEEAGARGRLPKPGRAALGSHCPGEGSCVDGP